MNILTIESEACRTRLFHLYILGRIYTISFHTLLALKLIAYLRAFFLSFLLTTTRC